MATSGTLGAWAAVWIARSGTSTRNPSSKPSTTPTTPPKTMSARTRSRDRRSSCRAATAFTASPSWSQASQAQYRKPSSRDPLWHRYALVILFLEIMRVVSLMQTRAQQKTPTSTRITQCSSSDRAGIHTLAWSTLLLRIPSQISGARKVMHAYLRRLQTVMMGCVVF